MKKKIIWGLAICLAILIVALLLIRSFWQDKVSVAGFKTVSEVKAESFVPSISPTVSAEEKLIGDIKAPLKIVVYEDYNNVFSAELAANLDKLKNDFGSELVIALRPYVIKGDTASLEAAMAVECATPESKWLTMRSAIFSAIIKDEFNPDVIYLTVADNGIDQDKFAQCLTDEEKQGIMVQVAENAKQFSVYGAPTIFIGNDLIIGARPYEDYLDETGAKIAGLKTLVAEKLK